MQIINISIDFTKISKDDLVKDKYLNLTVNVNDTKDKYDNDCSVIIAQSKEERAAKTQRKFVGNGRVVFSKSNENQVSNNSDMPF